MEDLSRKGMCSRCVKSEKQGRFLFCHWYDKLCGSVARNCKGPNVHGYKKGSHNAPKTPTHK